jgi:small subunit ribosomal protein S16
MLKIKLARTGKKNQPSFRIVVQEARSKINGKNVEILGYYLPLPQPAVIKIDKKKYQEWVDKGARPTETVRSLFKKA